MSPKKELNKNSSRSLVHRCLALVMYMCRVSVWTAAPALATRALSLVSSPGAQPALTSAMLAALAATANAVSQSNRFVT